MQPYLIPVGGAQRWGIIVPFLAVLLLAYLPLCGQNLIINGDFENGFANWNNLVNDGAVADFSLETDNVWEGTQAMRVDIQNGGANDWSVQSVQTPMWAAVPGEDYTLTVYARSETPGTQVRAVQQNATWAATDFNLTADWAEYTWNFTAQEAGLEFVFHFIDEGVVYLDGIELTTAAAAGEVRPTDTTTVDPLTQHQYMEGFGAALAFYENWVVAHPNKEAMYELAFEGLGLDWLRIRNTYSTWLSSNLPDPPAQPFDPEAVEFVGKAHEYRGDSIRVLMCSWTPPANIKNNNHLNEGTLTQQGGDFVYDLFGDYWLDALVAYDNLGIQPDWVSIQNEPDWLTDQWETCEFRPTETATIAGYDQAFDVVADRIAGLPNRPEMLGAEPLGIGFNQFDNFNSQIRDKPDLFGYAYHLYHGGDPNEPDTYNPQFHFIRDNYADRPNIMTEYEHAAAGWLKAAWLISNTLTEAHASAYFYWDLIWDGGGLLGMDFPWDPAQWSNPEGFTINPDYYAVKHFSRYIHAGYTRIGAVSSNPALRSSAYVNPQQDAITIVFVNTSTTDITSELQFTQDFSIASSMVIQSVEGNFDQHLGSLVDDEVDLPGESVTTIVLQLTAPLPVTLASFQGERQQADVQLTWETVSEEQNDRFVVERSEDGVDFSPIGSVAGQGNSNQRISYAYTDKQAPASVLYYRLKQVDYDGGFAYSPVITIEKEPGNIRVYPNPFTEELTVAVSAECRYVLRDIAGKTHRSGWFSQETTVSTASLKKGIYFIEVHCGDRRYVQKVVK